MSRPIILPVHRRAVAPMLWDLALLASVVLLVLVTHIHQAGQLIAVASTYGLLLAAALLILNTATGFYDPGARPTTAQVLARTCLSGLLGLPLAYAVFELLPQGVARAEVLAFSTTLGYVAVNMRRLFRSAPEGPALGRQRVLILGTGEAAGIVRQTLCESDPHTLVIGFVAGPNEPAGVVPAAQVLPLKGTLAETALLANASEIVVALTERRGGSMPLRELLDCRIHGVQVSDINTHFEKTLGQVLVGYVKADWLIFGSGFNQGTLRRLAKRVFDVSAALVLLVASAPILLLAMLLIKLESPGSVLFSQERVGRDNRPFRVLKLRSMREDAEKDGPRWAAASDDRVTRVGHVIRMLRIDELPQLLNVLAGDMSMVGPRPERPVFVDQLTRDIPYYAVRHSVKPGLTGWAQVRYQYGSTVEDAKHKLQYDLYYVKNHGVMLDLLILLETVVVVVTGRGAR